MSEPKEIIAHLIFSDKEPCIFGHLQIGTAHFEIAGIRRSTGKVDITGRRVKRKTPIAQTQMDIFDENAGGSRQGE